MKAITRSRCYQVLAMIAMAAGISLAGLLAVRALRSVMSWAEPTADLSGSSPVVRPHRADTGGQLRFAVASMLSAESTFASYRQLVRRVSRSVNRHDLFILRPSYADVRTALYRGEIDVAIVCTGTYLHGLESQRLKLLVQPLLSEGLEYKCVIIVPKSSPVDAVAGLDGKAMAFTDRESNTGYLTACVGLRDEGLEPRTLFSRVIFTGSHDRSVQAVAAAAVDAAAVDSLVLDSMCREDPDLRQHVKVIWSSEPYGPPPVVVPAGIDPQLEDTLRQAFLSLHEDDEGREMLAALGIRRFVPPDPKAYESAIETFRRYKLRKADAWP